MQEGIKSVRKREQNYERDKMERELRPKINGISNRSGVYVKERNLVFKRSTT